jgi:ribosome-interacting GTPase 1
VSGPVTNDQNGAMPANLTPAYKSAETAYRRASDPDERLECLRTMMRTIPKHKGTEHLRAEIKTKIKELTEAMSGPTQTGARGGPVTVIHPEGAAQIALIGPANSGKSTLHARLTGSHTHIGPYPFTTQFPEPGMLEHNEASIQLIDLPPISPEHPVPWIANALQPADGCMLVVDLSHPGCMEEVVDLHEMLAARRVLPTGAWDPGAIPRGDDELDLFTIHLPTLLIVNKIDQTPNVEEELDVFRELTDCRYPYLTVSAATGEGTDEIGPWLSRNLKIVRVYTKVPGQHADEGKPFTVREGQTVHDVARLVHRDIAANLKYARIWGNETFDGQQVGPDHQVSDGDMIELHG